MLAPGSFLWLLAHDLRLGWRGFASMLGRGASKRATITLLLAAFALHGAAVPLVRWLGPLLREPSTGMLPAVGLAGGIFSWMMAQSLFGATRTLYDRGDLDLLLGSPLPPARVVAAKCIAVMAGTLISVALILLPVADVGAILDRPAWLAIYPLLIGLGLAATSIGLAVAMALFRLLGPLRARVYAHMTGATLGGGFVLAAQVLAMLPESWRDGLAAAISSMGMAGTGGGVGPLAWAAINGDWGVAFAVLAVGTILFASTVRLLGGWFAEAALAAAGASSSAAGAGGKARFRSGLGASLRRKEWRLLTRDPGLLAQLSLQIIYTIPIAVVLVRSNVVPAAVALVPTIVVIAAQVTGSIAWLTVSGEDAPELIATAPVSQTEVDLAKLTAVVVPMLSIVAVPLAVLSALSPRAAIVALLFAAGACTSAALLNFWHPMPGNRRGMLRRHQQSKLIGLVEHGLAVLWTFASVFALIGSFVTLLPLIAVVAILAYARSGHLRRQADGGGPVAAMAAATTSA